MVTWRNEQDWEELLRERWSELGERYRELEPLINAAVEQHPQSSPLLCLKGAWIELCAIDQAINGEPVAALAAESLDLFRRAAEADAAAPEAWEEIGFHLDVWQNDFRGAEHAFREAIARGAGAESYAGLARVLAQTGRKAEALASIDPSTCAYALDSAVEKIAAEIREGIWS